MADIEERRDKFERSIESLPTLWQTIAVDVRETAAALRDAQKENADLRQQLGKLESQIGDRERLRQQNEWLQKQLRTALATKADDQSGDEHFSVPATQVFANTPPASSDEIVTCYPQLLREHHEQAAQIEALTELLRAEKEKSKRWRAKYHISSSPAPTPFHATPATDSGRPSSSPRSRPPYSSTAFDPTPIKDDCSRVSASPEPQEQKEAKPFHIKVEALQESSGNARKKRKISSSRGAEAIPAIAEDGEDHNRHWNSAGSTATKTKKPGPAIATAHQRLGNLLAESTAPRPRLLGPDAFLKPGRTASGHDSPPRRPRFLKPKSRKSLADAEDEEPFRARPVHRLSLNHFKINPETNEGLDYAYQDVVRNHHARKCLSGCTDKCCIDKWRAIAHTLYDTDNRGDETLDQQISNNGLLLDMLGPDSEEKIRTLTPAARAHLLDEARVRDISARYSRHRAAHPRAQTPPGFWNTDMPSTQETAENREKADKLEREEVERRHRDAMRGNGRWMFADE